MAPSLPPSALWSLVKPRIVGLLALTGVCAALAAGGPAPGRLVAFAVAGALVAAGSAALNCWYDRDLDREMARTADRPLPRGDLSPTAAAGFALTLLAGGTALGLATLPAAAVGYTLAGAAAYVGLYTVLLKRRHWLGVVLGGSAGSFPVLAGWRVVEPVGPEAIAMAALVFAWTPAHAWALAAVYRDDFAAAGVPTLPVVASPARVRRSVWRSALAAVGVAALPAVVAGPVYAATLAAAAPPFLLAYRRFSREGTDAAAVRAFFSSNLFLAVCFLAWGAGGVLPRSLQPGAVAAALSVPWLFVRLWRARPALRGVRGAVGAEWRPALARVRRLPRVLTGDG
jgi:protoheme IX farnesyltransferase